MKKLMIALAAVAVAAGVQAASVSWTCTNVKDTKGVNLTSGASYVFFYTSASAASAAMADFVAAEGKGASTLSGMLAGANWHDTKKTTLAGNFGIGTSAALGKYTLPTNGDIGLADATKYYMFMVVTDTETVTDATKFLVASGNATTAGATTAASSSGATVAFALGSQASNADWHSAAAPEPTSGLLVLLGMAGLALRRKCA